MLFSNLLVRQQTLQLCYVGRICEAFLAEVALQLSGLAMAVEQVALANVTANLPFLVTENLFLHRCAF